MAYIGIGPASFTNNLTNVQILDDISGDFDGNDQTFPLSSNTIPFQAVSDRALMVILGGVIQAPGVDYTINGVNITFTTAPVSGLTFYARNIYGLNALNGVNDGIVGPYSLTTGGPSWDTSGNTTISGNLTVQGATTTIQSTTLDVIDKDIKLASNQSTNAGIDTAGLLWGTTAVKLKYYNNGGTNPGLNIEGTNVGIGVTAPTAKLHIDGDVKFTGTSSKHLLWDKSDGALKFSDNSLAYYGSDNDLVMHHTGAQGYIKNTTGTLYIQDDSSVIIGKLTGSHTGMKFIGGGALELYHNNSIRFATTSNGVSLHGGADNCYAILKDTDGNYCWQLVGYDAASAGAGGRLVMADADGHTVMDMRDAGTNIFVKNSLRLDVDNLELSLGGGTDFKITHNGSENVFDASTSNPFVFKFAGTEKLRIDSSGHITPNAANTQDLGSTSKEFRNLYLGNSGKAFFGDAQELSLYHDGNNSYLKGDANAGLVSIQGQGNVELFANNKVLIRINGGESAVICNNNNSVDLYYDASVYTSPKLKTSKVGVTVNGEVAASQDYPTIRPTLDLNFAATKTLDPRIEYYRYGPASYVDENGKVVLVGDDVPRFDHDPSTRECKGLLVEGARRNILPYSFDAGKWVAQSGGTLTRDAGIAPDGTMTATKVLSSNNDIDLNPKISGTDGSSGNITVSSSVTYTLSIWAKASTTAQIGNNFKVRMKRVSGTSFSAETTFALTGNWVRYSVTGTTPGNVTQLMCYVGGVSGSEALVWGAQLESGTTASSLIPTYGYTQQREADVVQITGEDFTDFYNQEEGTIFLSASYETDARAVANVTIDDTSNYSEYTEVGYRAGGASTQQLASYIRTDTGNDQYYKNWSNAITQGTEFKIALAYKDDNYASHASTSGTPGLPDVSNIHTDSSGTTSRVYDRLKFSEVHTVGHGGVGHYRRFMYYSKRLTNNQIFTLTL